MQSHGIQLEFESGDTRIKINMPSSNEQEVYKSLANMGLLQFTNALPSKVDNSIVISQDDVTDVEDATADYDNKVQDCNIKGGNLDPQKQVSENREGESNQIFGGSDGGSFFQQTGSVRILVRLVKSYQNGQFLLIYWWNPYLWEI